MNSSYDSDRTDWAGLHHPALIEHCPHAFCSYGASNPYQPCSHRHPSQSFPAAHYYGPWGPVGLVRSFVPNNSLPAGPLCHSAYDYLPGSFCRPVRANFPYSEHSLCQGEGLGCLAWPVLRHEYCSEGAALPFPEPDQTESRIPTNISLSELSRSPSRTTLFMVPPVQLDMYNDLPAEIAAVSPVGIPAESDLICTRSVPSVLNEPTRLTDPAREEVLLTSLNDASPSLDTTIGQCSGTVSPADLFFSVDNDPLDCAAVSQEFCDSLEENLLPQHFPIASHVLFDGRKDDHAKKHPLLCSDKQEGLDSVEVSGNLDLEPSMSSRVSLESWNVSTGMMSDAQLLTPASTSTTPPSDEPLDEHMTPTPRPTSSANYTSTLRTLPVLNLHTPAESVTSVAVEAIRTSEMREEPPVQALACSFQGCTSKVLFTRICDLNKHHRQHLKRFFCRIEGCSMSKQPAHNDTTSRSSKGFATKKDRLRHETSHDPSITCEICGKVFSRADNMQNHMKRIHRGFLRR